MIKVKFYNQQGNEEFNYKVIESRLLEDIDSFGGAFEDAWYDTNDRTVKVAFRTAKTEAVYEVERKVDFGRIISQYPESADLIVASVNYRNSFNN